MCELCKLKRKTQWYYVNDNFIICNCKSCGIRMLVFRAHGPRPNIEHNEARELIIWLYGNRIIKVKTKIKKITLHEHWHIALEEES